MKTLKELYENTQMVESFNIKDVTVTQTSFNKRKSIKYEVKSKTMDLITHIEVDYKKTNQWEATLAYSTSTEQMKLTLTQRLLNWWTDFQPTNSMGEPTSTLTPKTKTELAYYQKMVKPVFKNVIVSLLAVTEEFFSDIGDNNASIKFIYDDVGPDRSLSKLVDKIIKSKLKEYDVLVGTTGSQAFIQVKRYR